MHCSVQAPWPRAHHCLLSRQIQGRTPVLHPPELLRLIPLLDVLECSSAWVAPLGGLGEDHQELGVTGRVVRQGLVLRDEFSSVWAG